MKEGKSTSSLSGNLNESWVHQMKKEIRTQIEENYQTTTLEDSNRDSHEILPRAMMQSRVKDPHSITPLMPRYASSQRQRTAPPHVTNTDIAGELPKGVIGHSIDQCPARHQATRGIYTNTYTPGMHKNKISPALTHYSTQRRGSQPPRSLAPVATQILANHRDISNGLRGPPGITGYGGMSAKGKKVGGFGGFFKGKRQGNRQITDIGTYIQKEFKKLPMVIYDADIEGLNVKGQIFKLAKFPTLLDI